MTFRKSILLLTSLSLLLALVACGSSGSSSTPPPAITVALGTTPTSLYVNDLTRVTATVANDPANGGVTWSCAPAGSCGLFVPGQTASGAAATYVAPATVPASPVVITATSVTNTAKSASTPAITINPASGIEVSLSKVAQWSLATGATATISATVANDSTNGGVTWSCTPATTCGSFSPSQTASGAMTTYTAPSAAGTVVITATSVSDDAQSASTTVTVTGGGVGLLADGSYVFSLSGADVLGSFQDPQSVAGVFVVKGGTISGGEQDYADFYAVVNDQINPSGSSIATTGDGNLQITLQTCLRTDCTQTDTAIGVFGVETLNGSLVSASRALITEFDASASSSGTLDLQTSTAAPSGGYAFEFSGLGNIETCTVPIGGVINIDNVNGPGTISGTGSIFDANNCESGFAFQAETFAASNVSVPPDSNGRVMFTLNPTDSADFSQIMLVGYIVDATHIRLLDVRDV